MPLLKATRQPVSRRRVSIVQLLADHRAAGMHEGQAVTFELLQDETLAAEETGTQAFGEADADAGAMRRAEKGIFLADQARRRSSPDRWAPRCPDKAPRRLPVAWPCWHC